MRALIGLAANPAAPLDVLLRLAVVPEAADGIAWKQKTIPVALAERLLATDALRVASTLGKLGSPDVLRLISEHPNAEVRDARRDTTMQLINLEIPVSTRDLQRFAGEGGLASLAVHEDPLVRAGVARSWTDMPDDTRRALLVDPVAEVREAACLVRVPEDLHARMLADEATRMSVASYAALTPGSAAELVESDHQELRYQVALNPTLPIEFRDRLAEDPDPVVRVAVMMRADTSDSLRARLHEALLAEPDNGVFGSPLSRVHDVDLSWVRDLPLPRRLALLDSPVHRFRAEVAGSDLPTEVFARLDSHEDAEIRRAAAGRPDTPPAVLVRFMLENDEYSIHRPSLADHPNFPPEGFVALAASPHHRRRVLALKGPDLPADLVAALAADPQAYIRKAAAGHPRIPLACLETLLLDDDPEVVEAAGASPALPEAVMVRLLDEAGL